MKGLKTNTFYVFHNEYDGTEIMYLRQDFTQKFKSVCHDQPVMENTGLFIGEEQGEGYCRRCGKWGALNETGFFNGGGWLNDVLTIN